MALLFSSPPKIHKSTPLCLFGSRDTNEMPHCCLLLSLPLVRSLLVLDALVVAVVVIIVKLSTKTKQALVIDCYCCFLLFACRRQYVARSAALDHVLSVMISSLLQNGIDRQNYRTEIVQPPMWMLWLLLLFLRVL